MGLVYLAEQEQPIRRRVALKVIKIGMDTHAVVARFEAERQALALMNHPCIAEVYEAGASDDGRPYVAMEYVAGIPITDYCDKHRLSMPARLELFMQLCGAIQHAHQKGVIHRDIKPSNVLVAVQDGKPVPKVIDFGVAKATHQRLTEKTVFTQHGLLIGTPSYMSPEQAEMSGLDVDTTTDIYSLGVVLYELLIGALPFDPEALRNAGYAEIQRIIREEEPLRPSARLSSLHAKAGAVATQRRTDPAALARELKGDLDWITLKAMDKDRTRRYASASELAADIGRHLQNEPVMARPASALYRTSKFVTKHLAAVVAGALAVTLLGLAFGVSVALYVRSENARELAEWQAYLAAIAAAEAHITAADSNTDSGFGHAAAREAERRLIAAPARWRNWEWHFLVRKLDDSIATMWGATTDPTIQGRPGHYIGRLAVSAGNTELFWTTYLGVHVWDLKAYRLVAAWPGYGLVAALADDGSKMLSYDWRAEHPWRIVSTPTGSIVSTLATDRRNVRLAAFSPTGEHVALADGNGEITVWATRSGGLRSTARAAGSVERIRFAQRDDSLTVVTSSALYLWSMSGPDEPKALPLPPAFGLVAADVSVDGRTVVTADDSGTLRVWQLESGENRIVGRHPGVTEVAISTSAKSLASGGDKAIQFWRLVGRTESPSVHAHGGVPVNALLFTRDDTHVIAGSRGGVLRVFEVPRTVSSSFAARLREGLPVGGELSQSGRFMISRVLLSQHWFTSATPKMSRAEDVTPESAMPWGLFDLETLRTQPVRLAANAVTLMSVNNDGTRIAFAEPSGTIKLMMDTNPDASRVLIRPNGTVRALAIDGGGNRVAAIWSSGSRQGQGTVLLSDSSADDDGRAITAVWSSTIDAQEETGTPSHLRVVDATSGRALLTANTRLPRSLLWSGDGNTLLALPRLQHDSPLPQQRNGPGRCADPIEVWDVRGRRLTFTIAECGPAIFAGPHLITTSPQEHTLRVWDSSTGRLRATSHDAPQVVSLAATSDGTRIAAVMPDRIGIFDSANASLVLTITANLAVPQVRFAGGDTLVSVDRWLSERSWQSQSFYHPAARALARTLLRLEGDLESVIATGRRRTRTLMPQPPRTLEGTREVARDPGPSPPEILLADEVAEQLVTNRDLLPDVRGAAIEEVRRVGDRDLDGLCRTSQSIVLRNATAAANQRALKMASIVARFAPWSAHCIGILGMAKYRTGDYSGALSTLAAASEQRSDSDIRIEELVFKAMTLYRLGRTAEAVAAAENVSGRVKNQEPASELSHVLAELASLASTSK